MSGSWSEPAVITYSGGYKLPDEAPPALKTAVGILIQAARMQARLSATSGIRSIAHRESRVQFFDAQQMLGAKGVAAPLQAAGDTVDALLYKFMRINV